MVDWFSIKPGDKVRIKVNSISGWHFHTGNVPQNISQQELIVFGFNISAGTHCATKVESVDVGFTDSQGGPGRALANPDDLELVADPVATLHDMRSAGPPAPASCSCDIMSLMRAGCRCGYMAKEREAANA
jgi:hypothetical protein